MKKFVLIILIALNFIYISAQTETNQSALQEAEKTSIEVVKLFKAKKFEEAVPLARKVISIRENALGKNHILVAQAWRNLAYIQVQLDNRKEAESAFKKALEIYAKAENLSVEDEKILADLLESVAVYEALNLDFTSAEKKLASAIELREKNNGKDALETADPMLKLAQIYEAEGDYKKAAPLLLRALEIRSAKLGNENDKTLEVFDNAYCVLTKLAREDEAKQLEAKFNPQPTDKDKTINAGIVNGKAINLVTPVYPREARLNHTSGTVKVKIKIDETGKVIYACAVEGAKELQKVCEIAAYQSKFTPTLLKGETVKVTGVIVYSFHL